VSIQRNESVQIPSVTAMKLIFNDIRRRSQSLPELHEPHEEEETTSMTVTSSTYLKQLIIKIITADFQK